MLPRLDVCGSAAAQRLQTLEIVTQYGVHMFTVELAVTTEHRRRA